MPPTDPVRSFLVPRQGSVTVYAPNAAGDARPIRMIVGGRTKLARPSTIALDRTGKVWVAGPSPPVAAAFSAAADGDAEPVERLLEEVSDLAFGEDGTLLALGSRGLSARLPDGSIRAHPMGGERLFSRGPPRLAAGRGGEFYVARWLTDTGPPATKGDSIFARLGTMLNQKPAVVVYPSPLTGDTAPLRTILGPKADLGEISDLAVGSRRLALHRRQSRTEPWPGLASPSTPRRRTATSLRSASSKVPAPGW